MARFFIERPVFAWVIAIAVMVSGSLWIPRLPVSQYPDVALPQISIYGQYPGASAKIVDQGVTQIVEQQMKGLENLLYMRSSSDALRNVEVYFTFRQGRTAILPRCRSKTRYSRHSRNSRRKCSATACK